MLLEQYISNLLFSKDCVVVPGFGAFVTMSFSAELNLATQMFTPPGKRLSFQPGLRTDDGVLRKEIARLDNRSQDVVRLEVSDIVSDWHSQLHKGERIRLEGLGLFYIDRQGELQFKPQIDTNYDASRFGLGVFRASPLVSIPSEKRVIPLHERKDRKRNNFWHAAAVAVGVTGLLTIGGLKSDLQLPTDLAGFMKFGDSLEIEQSAAALEENKIEEANTEADAETTQQETIANEVEETVADVTPAAEVPSIEITAEPVTETPVQAGTYYVIVGSFVEVNNANDLFRELKSKGYNPVLLPFDGRFNKVAVAEFSSRASATEALRSYKRDVQRGAWIYRK